MQQLETLGALIDMQWGSCALYESVSGKLHTLTGLLDALACRIGVKQGCPLLPTLFSLYIHKISNYIDRMGRTRACLARASILIPLYAYAIVLILNSP